MFLTVLKPTLRQAQIKYLQFSIKKTCRTLCFPISVLFRSLLDLHNLPSEWKHSIISPKFKSGSPSDPKNYRPISLTCTCCKVLESIIVAELLEFLNTHKLISKHQHGFLKLHSTTTNLLETINDWTISLSNHKSVTIAYVDFQRAFDTISHPKLIHKLISYGVSGNLLFWIQSFLSNRTQVVRITSSFSSVCGVSSGVPQGSVLGPILFDIFINDLVDIFDGNATAKLFADDLKLYTDITFPSDRHNFQVQLDLLCKWSTQWQLGISYSKCSILQLGSPTNFPTTHFKTHPL